MAIGLAAIIVAGSLFYVFTSLFNPAKAPTKKEASLRYDEVLRDDFEGGTPSPSIWNVTGGWGVSNGPDYPSSNNGCYQGSYCMWSGTSRNSNSQMVLNLSVTRSFVDYTSLLLNFSVWVDTNPNDVVYVDYYNEGSWSTAIQYSGHMSTTQPLNKTLNGWLLAQVTLPTATTMMRFRYSTGCCETLYGGVYIDEVGVYMVGPGSFGRVLVTGWYSTPFGSRPLVVAISLDGGPYFKSFAEPGHNIGITFLTSPGNHLFTVPSFFTDGSSSYAFMSWSNGSNRPSITVTVPTASGLQLTVTFGSGT